MSNSRKLRTERLPEMLKALSNPHRLEIVLRLASCCAPGTVCTTDGGMGACVGELGRNLRIAPSTVSHHIKELHRAGLIRVERRGQKVACSIDPGALGTLRRFLDGLPADRGAKRRSRRGPERPPSRRSRTRTRAR